MDPGASGKEANTLVLTEGTVLGGGAFSRVSIVTGEWASIAALMGMVMGLWAWGSHVHIGG